jgi:hypothetical protein
MHIILKGKPKHKIIIKKKKKTKIMGVSHCDLAIYIKNILRQKKSYGNSNISPCKNIIFKKLPLKETKILQNIIIP